MKFFPATLAIFTLAFFSACTKNGHDHNLSGSWKISFYWDEKDETNNFTDYYFMFNNGGQVMAHKGTGMYTGTWSETSTRFTIDFGTDPILSKLNKVWLKEEETDTFIKLKDDNPVQDDRLQFTKN
jgi:hypothetical protein